MKKLLLLIPMALATSYLAQAAELPEEKNVELPPEILEKILIVGSQHATLNDAMKLNARVAMANKDSNNLLSSVATLKKIATTLSEKHAESVVAIALSQPQNRYMQKLLVHYLTKTKSTLLLARIQKALQSPLVSAESLTTLRQQLARVQSKKSASTATLWEQLQKEVIDSWTTMIDTFNLTDFDTNKRNLPLLSPYNATTLLIRALDQVEKLENQKQLNELAIIGMNGRDADNAAINFEKKCRNIVEILESLQESPFCAIPDSRKQSYNELRNYVIKKSPKSKKK